MLFLFCSKSIAQKNRAFHTESPEMIQLNCACNCNQPLTAPAMKLS